MAAVKTPGTPYTVSPQLPWEQTPKWHWRYWVGHRMRQKHNGDYPYHNEPAWWRYRTFKQHAHIVLAEAYANKDEGQRNAQTFEQVQNEHRRTRGLGAGAGNIR